MSNPAPARPTPVIGHRRDDRSVAGNQVTVRLLTDPQFQRWLRNSCAQQNVPVTITDPGAITKIATLFR